MLILEGSNLGKRQQELNEEVLKTTSKNIDFNSIKVLKEQSDVDRLYKIDVASGYKNIDYIVETLKSGDNLYISRALKCSWLYESDSSFIINPDYLHHEVFPFMSIKMKKKMLTTVSMHVRDEKRSEDFYKYCLTDKKLYNIAEKFLIWSSEQHKIEFLTSNNNIDDIKKIRHIIGNSFNLAEAYLAKEKNENRNTNETVHEFRYLIKISNEKYLDLMESYTDINEQCHFRSAMPKLGLRLSKDIITKHKERVLNNIQLYFKKLNMCIIAKHSSIEDVKRYADALLPPTASDFWSMNFYESYKKIFNILPQNEVYIFLRQLFVSKYQNEPFEISKDFYDLKYYQLLTYKEREMWALEHLRNNSELLGPDSDYIWYQFVNFDLAFKEIKKYVSVCTDHYKRAAMVNILIESTINDEELGKLLRYYYDRHINENEDYKMSFIDNVCDKSNVFKFSENCWDAFNKILHSTNIFSLEYSSFADNKYKTLIILYHIIHDNAIPNVLENYVTTKSNAYNIKYDKENLYNKLTADEINLVYQKFIELSTNKLIHFDTQTYDTVKDDAREIIDFALLIMETFEKTKTECPDVILKYVKLDWDFYKGHDFFVNKEEEITEAKLLQLLKLDSKLLLKKLPDLSDFLSRITINNLLKKIKVYFPNDVGKDWLCCCESLLEKSGNQISLFNAIIVAIFHIGSDDYKIAFVSKYVPQEAKISYDKIDRRLLTIQEGICRFAQYSRPPVPLECILPYIKGDYVHYCLPMFGSYLNNLPMPQCIKFVSAILNTPVSIQKHALRLAFQCFSVEDLTNLIVNVWKTTKNVSLRVTIYRALFEKIENVDQNSQGKLYEVLKNLTLDLHENDDDAVFSFLTRFKLIQYKGDFLETAWNTVQKLSEQRSKNIQRKIMILNEIKSDIALIDKEFCRTVILEDFVRSILADKHFGQLSRNNDIKNLIDSKWILAAKYIIHIDNDQIERNLELVHFILHRCSEMWDITDNGTYTSRKFMFWFINQILLCSFCQNNKTDSIPVLEYIVKLICELLPMTQIYTLYVEFNLIIISKKVLGSNECNYVHLVPENIANDLANEIIAFLSNLKVKKMLYSSFNNEIASLLRNAIDCMSYGTNLNNIDSIATLVSSRLIEAQLPEARLLALSILPREQPDDCAPKWLDVIGNIQNGDNEELKAYVYEHFLHRNLK